jgi:hypothetical protein
LDLARQEAVSRSTYVWVAFQSEDNRSTSGGLDLRIGLACSRDGSPRPDQDNLQAIGPSMLIARSALTPVGDLDREQQRLQRQISECFDLGNIEPSNLDFFIGGARFARPRIITFTPRGEATREPRPTASTGFDPLIGIGLRQTRGNIAVSGDDAAVVLVGSVGIPQTFHIR